MGKLAFIWDLDGTLLDSYETIVTSVSKTLQEFNISLDREMIYKEIITTSVNDFFYKIEKETGISFESMKEKNSLFHDKEKLTIKPIKNAEEILFWLKARNIPNYVFTHRGISTESVLKNIGIFEYFDDVVTGKDGFPRKPDPSALNYLIQKYKLDKEKTYYVGDRTIDVACADNAGIRSILYLPEESVVRPTGKETCIVKDLLEIKDITANDIDGAASF